MFHAIFWVVKKNIMPPNAVVPMKIGKYVVSEKEMSNAALYGILYLSSLMAGAVVFMFSGESVADSLFEVASALGNVGLSVGLTGPDMPVHEKLVLIIEMWIGRLEIFPVLMMILSPFRKDVVRARRLEKTRKKKLQEYQRKKEKTPRPGSESTEPEHDPPTG